MRTIKFRGRSRKTGEWLVGDLLQVANEAFIAPSDGDWFDFIPWSKNNVFHLPSAKYEVISDTVGQFTGLLDKNGKEIYEGDIIRGDCGNGEVRHLISFFDITASFVAEMLPNNDINDYCTLSQVWILKYNKEVIGNIYDNPELLKQ